MNLQSSERTRLPLPPSITEPPVRTTPTGAAAGHPSIDFASVLVLDRRSLGRDCLVRSLVATTRRTEITSASSLDEWCGSGEPDLILLVLHGDPLEPAVVRRESAAIARTMPSSAVLVLADTCDLPHVRAALDGGAKGYVPDTSPMELLCGVIQVLLAGGTHFPVDLLRLDRPAVEPADKEVVANFTPREIEVAKELRQGKANKIIAHDLQLCEGTVKVHVRNIMRKLKVTNRAEAAFRLA